MQYVVLVKTVVDENGNKKNVIEKVAHVGDIELKTMYKLCECEYIDIKEVPFRLSWFDGEMCIIPAVTMVFDDEFLLNHSKPIANELASLVYGYGQIHYQCLCGSVMLCVTNQDGDCVPFQESEADAVIKCLHELNNHVDSIEFIVQEPMMSYRAF